MSDSFDIRIYRSGDEAGILESFNRVFREVCGPEYVDRAPDFWQWEFAQNPAGHRITVAETGEGGIGAHYAGVPQRMRSHFGELVFVHIVDSFVVPELRAGLKRPGLFVRTAYPWFDLCREQGDTVMYGYPVKTAERVGSRYLEYHFLRVIQYLLRPVASGPLTMPQGVEVRQEPEFPEGVDALEGELAQQYGCWVRRDRRYLDWRYRQIPDRDEYEIHTARRDGELCGLMVLRTRHELVPGACTVADWLAPQQDPEVQRALLATADARARAAGREQILAVFADGSAEAAACVASGFEQRSSGDWMERRLTYRSYRPEVTGEWLSENWWYTLGDSDLV